jgi:hypothetical protein
MRQKASFFFITGYQGEAAFGWDLADAVVEFDKAGGDGDEVFGFKFEGKDQEAVSHTIFGCFYAFHLGIEAFLYVVEQEVLFFKDRGLFFKVFLFHHFCDTIQVLGHIFTDLFQKFHLIGP